MAYLGIIFALIALLCWGFGDFFIQRASRKIGIVQALFFNTLVVAVLVLPFVYTQLIDSLGSTTFWILIASGIIVFFTALLQFRVLEIGKLSVVEPVASLELPFTVLIAAALGSEILSLPSYVLITIVFIGITMTVSSRISHLGILLTKFEKGTFIALAGALGMALTNFLYGHGGQISSPLLAFWIIETVIMILSGVYLIYSDQFRHLYKDFKKAPGAIIAESTFDNIAWLSFTFAVLYIPISVAIAISESYIILAVVLGVLVNRERLKHHQYLGVFVAFVGVLLLAITSG